MTTRHLRRICVILPLVFSVAVHARDLTPVHQCMEGKITNIEWADCKWAEVRAQESLLEKIWNQASTEYWNRNEGYLALLADQKQWELHKKTACEIYSIDFGREGQVLDYPNCKAQIIAQRIEYLEHLLTALRPD